MIIRSIKTGQEIEVMEGTAVPEGFAIKVVDHTCETKKIEKSTEKTKKGAKKHGKDER